MINLNGFKAAVSQTDPPWAIKSPRGGQLSRASHSLSSTKSDPGHWCGSMNTKRPRLRRNFSSFLNKPCLSNSCSGPVYHQLPSYNSMQLNTIPHHRNLYLTVTSPEGLGQEIKNGQHKKIEKESIEKDDLNSSSSVEQKSTCSEPRLHIKQQLLGDQLQPWQLKLAPRRNSDSSEVTSLKQRKHYRRIQGRLRNVNSLSPAPR